MNDDAPRPDDTPVGGPDPTTGDAAAGASAPGDVDADAGETQPIAGAAPAPEDAEPGAPVAAGPPAEPAAGQAPPPAAGTGYPPPGAYDPDPDDTSPDDTSPDDPDRTSATMAVPVAGAAAAGGTVGAIGAARAAAAAGPPTPPVGDAAADGRPPAEKAGITGALAAIGAGLGGAAAVIALLRGTGDDGIDWSVYASGLVAVGLLLLLSLGGALLARRTDPAGARADLITWPGVVGILGLALLLPVWLDDLEVDKQPYIIGALIVVLSILGFLLARRPAFAVTAVLGLGIAYAQGFADLFGDTIDGDDRAVWIALATTAFVAVITIVGWALPSRAVVGVAVGVVGVIGIGGSLAMLFAMRMVATVLSESGLGDMSGMLLGGMLGADNSAFNEVGGWSAVPADYQSDVGIVLAFAGGLVLLWALAAVISNHSGFPLLIIAMAAVALPLAVSVLAVEHPTWWVAGLGAAGAVVVLLAAPLMRRRQRRVTT